jgi:hypothetical protein
MADDFEAALRQGLMTLAREAVPDAPASHEALAAMRSVSPRRARRLGPRLLAAGIAVAVATASVVVALSVHSRSHTPVISSSARWMQIAPFPLAPRSAQAAVFTGHEVIVWGGRSDAAGAVAPAAGPSSPRYTLGDGAAYDVGTDRWRVLPRPPIAGRYDAVAVWTGTEMLVVGGRRDHAEPQGGIGFLPNGAAYDPAHRSWRRLPAAPVCPMFGAWTGTQLVVGGSCADIAGARPVFAAYDPVHDTWSTFPVFASATQLVAARGRLYAWSSATGRSAVFEPGPRRWRALPAIRQGHLEDSIVVAYEDRLAVIGRESGTDGGPDLGAFFFFDPRGRAWTGAASRIGPPIGGSVAVAAAGAVVWSGFGLSSVSTDPAVRRIAFANVGDAPISLDRTGESIVAIGYRRFLVWGGRLAGNEHNQTNYPTADGAILQLP